MLRTLLLGLVLVFGGSCLANTATLQSVGSGPMGEIQGKVTDKTGQPLDMVMVVVTRSGNELAHGYTDPNGFYSIPVEAGSYTLYFELDEYRTVEMPGIVVRSEGITFLNQQMERTSVNLPPIIITPKEEIISADGKGPIFKIRGPMLEKKPSHSWQGAISNAPGVYVRDDGEPSSIGGSRNYSNVVIVDGVQYYGNAADIPMDAIEEISVSLTGVSAKYGDFTGGVIEITTRSF